MEGRDGRCSSQTTQPVSAVTKPAARLMNVDVDPKTFEKESGSIKSLTRLSSREQSHDCIKQSKHGT